MRFRSLPILLLCAAPAIAQTNDYLLVFSADGVPYGPTKGHTFAAVVRAEKIEGQPGRVVELTSLSWLPASGKVRAFAVRSEQGRNVPLEETLRSYPAPASRICLWGPYHIQPELAEVFKKRVADVETSFAYKGAAFTSRMHVCDCARSVEEMVTGRRRYIGVFGYGAAAASVVVQEFSPWMLEPDQTHDWVGALIGLDQHEIVNRPIGDYSTRQDQAGAWMRRK